MKNLKKTAFYPINAEALTSEDLFLIEGGCPVKTLGMNIASWSLDDNGNRVEKVNATITYTYCDEKDFYEFRRFMRENNPWV